jgi:hypothetical protein
VQHVEQLPLVFVDALDLHVEQRGRVDRHAGDARQVVGQAPLVGGLDAGEGGLGLTDAIRARLVEQLTAPVRWSESCSWLAASRGRRGIRRFFISRPASNPPSRARAMRPLR